MILCSQREPKVRVACEWFDLFVLAIVVTVLTPSVDGAGDFGKVV